MRSAFPTRRQGERAPARGSADETLTTAGRAGFTARGVIYVLVGVLAVRIAMGDDSEQADRQGALQQVAEQPFGLVMLWTLAVGFGCMALWRGARAVLGKGHGGKAGPRLLDGLRAVVYGAVCWATVAYAAGSGSSGGGSSGGGSSGSDSKSQDWTATVLDLPFGRLLVGLAGCTLIVVGVVLAVRAALRRFLRRLDTASMSRRAEQAVTVLGVAGGVARGAVFAAVGVFVLVAAVRFDPDEAKGVDDTLRTFAQTPAGPWLLVAVAVGLVLYGLLSFVSARWRRL